MEVDLQTIIFILLFSTQNVGKSGEDFVCNKISALGFKILQRNFREKFGEIDIIALDGKTLCFIEVRTRNSDLLGHPSETVDLKKQHQIRRVAEFYLMKHRISNTEIRFDVATVVWDKYEYLYFKNAF